MFEIGRSFLMRMSGLLTRRRSGFQQVLADRALFERSELFDARDYLQMYPDVAASGMEPAEHYVLHGAAELRNPSRRFDAAKYADENPEARESPLKHYLIEGRRHGCLPCSVVDPVTSAIASRGIFDCAYYLERYPEVRNSLAVQDMGPRLGAISEYVENGARIGKWPCQAFDTSFYMSRYPDVAASRINPLLHYCEFGGRELRNPCADFDAFAYCALYMDCEVTAGSPLEHLLESGAERSYLLAAVKPATLNAELVERAFVKAVGNTTVSAQVAHVAGRWFMERKRWAGAEAAYESLIQSGNARALDYRECAKAHLARGNWQAAVDALCAAAEVAPSDANIPFRIGQILLNHERASDACRYFEVAAELDPQNARRWYELGHSLQSSGSGELSMRAYLRALAENCKDDTGRLGIGVFHENAQRWPLAVEAYRTQSAQDPGDPELCYRLARCLERCYSWHEAAEAYERAISLSFWQAEWHYRYAFVLERLERWAEAASAYAACGALGSKRADRVLRRAYCLAKSGDYEESCVVYLSWDSVLPPSERRLYREARGEPAASDAACSDQAFALHVYRGKFSSVDGALEALKTNPLDGASFAALGEALEACSDDAAAVDAYQQALLRLETHRPDVSYRLGRALSRVGDFRSAAEAFEGMLFFRSTAGLDVDKLKLSAAHREIAEYCDFRENLAVSESIILYESYGGISMACNPYAIFRSIVHRTEFSDKIHVWVLNDKRDADEAYVGLKNVIFVKRNSRLHRQYLATAGYLIHNSSFPALFVRRPEQRYLNTWHGTPLKTLGRDIKGNFMERRHSVRSRLQATHLINPNPHTTHVLMDRCDISGLFAGEVAETGYPRNDVLVNASEVRKQSIRRRLGLSESSKVVLYAPTWRGILFHPEINPDRLISDLTALSGLDCEIVFRGHYFAEAALKDSTLPVCVAPHAVDTADLLSVTDVLITDYSSVFFDFLPTRRPILFYTYDLQQYVSERGLYFDMRDMPGCLCDDIVTLQAQLSALLKKRFIPDEKYERAIAQFAPHEDGQATQRVNEFFFNGAHSNISQPTRTRPTFLIYAGDFDPQDSRAIAAAECVKEIAKISDVTLLIDAEKVGGRSRNRVLFDQVSDAVRVIARVGARTASLEERWVISQYVKRSDELPIIQMDIYRKAYEREFERLLGRTDFDICIDLSPGEEYWSSLLAFGGAPGRRIMLKVSETTCRNGLKRLDKYYQVMPLNMLHNEMLQLHRRMSDPQVRHKSDAQCTPGDLAAHE